MVETEQGRVERYLREGHGLEAPELRRELDGLVNDTRPTLGLTPQHIAWAKAATGAERLSFFDYAHRVAISKAMVFALHGRSRDDYLVYVRSGASEYPAAAASSGRR